MAALLAPILAPSGSAVDRQTTPTTLTVEPVDTAPASTIDVTAMDPDGVFDRARTGLDNYFARFGEFDEPAQLPEFRCSRSRT